LAEAKKKLGVGHVCLQFGAHKGPKTALRTVTTHNARSRPGTLAPAELCVTNTLAAVRPLRKFWAATVFSEDLEGLDTIVWCSVRNLA
jgi:hypothetical protein